MKIVKLLSALALVLSAILSLVTWSVVAAPAKRSAAKNDWPAWRGANRTGISPETGLARTWPEGGPKLLWKATGIGEGFSTPSVAGNLILVMGNREDQEYIFALDRNGEGKQVWATALGAVRANGGGYPGPRSTPTVDGALVYSLGLNGDLVCLKTKTGELVWQLAFPERFGGAVGGWGYCESVLIDGPHLVCMPGGGKATLAKLNKKTGETVWESPVGDNAGYSSVIKHEIDGVKQYIAFTSKGVVGVRAADGKFLWRYDAPANGTANCSTVVADGNRVFAASGYGTGGGLAEVHQSGDGFEAKEAFFTKEMQNHHGGMILLEGDLFGSNDPGMLTCMEFATGKVKWKAREPGKCSLVYADGMLIARSEDGKVTLVSANPDAFELLGAFDQPDRSGAATWPHPVVAGGKLLLRDQDVLLCYEIGK